jgi:hypothetical protein
MVDDHLLLRDSEPYGIIFMDLHVVIFVVMVADHLLLRDYGICEVIL